MPWYHIVANIDGNRSFAEVVAPDSRSAAQLVCHQHRGVKVEIESSIMQWSGPLRNLRKMRGRNDGTRSLSESIVLPQVIAALKDWLKSARANPVLIGGVARSFYVKPFHTADIDFLFASEAELPTAVRGFERLTPTTSASRHPNMGKNSFRHRKLGIHVDAITPADCDIPSAVLAKVFDTAIRRGMRVDQNGGPCYVKIASRSALVAMKLFGWRMRGESDIISLIKSGPVDLTPFPLARKQLRAYEKLVTIAARENAGEKVNRR